MTHWVLSTVPPMQDGENETPLLTACRKGDVTMAELLLKPGADANEESGEEVRGLKPTAVFFLKILVLYW
jgi:ankyrin repeat protein